MRITRDDWWHRLVPILAAQAVGLACGLCGVWLVSEWVAPTDYGIYGVFVTLTTIGASVVFAGPLKFIGRNWQTAPDRGALLHQTLLAIGHKTPWLVALCIAATIFIRPERPWLYGGLLLATALFVTLAQTGQTALQAARDHWRDFGVSVGISLTRSFGPPLLYLVSSIGVAALQLGFLLQAVVGTLLAATHLWRWRTAAAAGASAPVRGSVYDGPRFVALAAAGWILVGLNRWIVAAFFGPELAGYYTLAANLGGILPLMIGMVLLQFVQPRWFAAEHGTAAARQSLGREVDRIAIFYAICAILAAAIVHVLTPRLIGTLIGTRYAAAQDLVFVAGCSTIATTTGLYFHAMLMAAKRERDCFTADVGGLIGLVTGGILSAAAGLAWFKVWLWVAPVVPWLINRSLARRALSRPT